MLEEEKSALPITAYVRIGPPSNRREINSKQTRANPPPPPPRHQLLIFLRAIRNNNNNSSSSSSSHHPLRRYKKSRASSSSFLSLEQSVWWWRWRKSRILRNPAPRRPRLVFPASFLSKVGSFRSLDSDPRFDARVRNLTGIYIPMYMRAAEPSLSLSLSLGVTIIGCSNWAMMAAGEEKERSAYFSSARKYRYTQKFSIASQNLFLAFSPRPRRNDARFTNELDHLYR